MMINSKIKSLLIVAGLTLLHCVGYADNQKEKMRHFAQIAYDNLDSDFRTVSEYSNKIIFLAEQQNDTAFLVYGLKLQGTVQDNLLNYSAALQCFQRNFQLNPEDGENLQYLANAHRKAGNFKEALYYYEMAGSRITGQKMSQWAGQQGLLYLDKGNYDKAEMLLGKELEYAKTKEDSLRYIVDMAHYHYVKGDLKKTKEFLDNGFARLQPYIKKGEQLYLQACFFSTLGQYHLAKQQIAPSKEYFEKALEIAHEQNLGVVMRDAYEGLLEVAFREHNTEAYERYSALKEDFLKERNRELNKYYELLIESKQNVLAMERDKAQKAQDEIKAASYYWIACVVFLLLVVAGLISRLLRYRRELDNHEQELALKDLKIEDLQERLLSKVTLEKD